MENQESSQEEIANLRQPRFCSHCGEPLTPGTNVCPVCSPTARPLPATEHDLQPAEVPLHRPGDNDIRNALLLYGMLLGSSALTFLTPFDKKDFLARVFIFDIMMAVIVIGMVALSWKTIVRALPGPVRFVHLGVAFAAAAVTFAAGIVYSGVLVPLLPENLPNIIDMMESAGLSRWKQLAIIAIYPAVFEELAFRGLFLPFLTVRMPVAHAVVASSAAFAILHMDWVSLPFLFGLGLVLGWLRVTSGSLIPPMLAHFLHNGAIVIAESLT